MSILPSATLYSKTASKYFPVQLCTTRLAKRTSLYRFVLQGLHNVHPTASLYYKACAKYFPGLPDSDITEACTAYFPVLLCTTWLAQRTSQFYLILQSLRKVLPSTTLYYKASSMFFPVLFCPTNKPYKTYLSVLLCSTLSGTKLLCTTKLARSFPVLLCTTTSSLHHHRVLQDLHIGLPSITWGAQNTFRYYFVLQNLQALPSTTLYF